MLEEQFILDGYASISSVFTEMECNNIVDSIAGLETDSPGNRCALQFDWCRTLAAHLRHNSNISKIVSARSVVVQCTYFEKSSLCNWLVPIHQDLSIPVAEKIESTELRGWSEKEGNFSVQPPLCVLEKLIAVRVHLDPCGIEDGPLQIIPGTHQLGRLTPEIAAEIRRQKSIVSCTAERGDVLIMKPLILHSSSKSSGESKRRVLHFLFGPRELPYDLRWKYAV